MFRALLCPSSGACDYAVDLTHWSFCSWFAVGWRLGAFNLTSNTQQTKNEKPNVVTQQHSRELLMMDIRMPEKCRASNN